MVINGGVSVTVLPASVMFVDGVFFCFVLFSFKGIPKCDRLGWLKTRVSVRLEVAVALVYGLSD